MTMTKRIFSVVSILLVLGLASAAYWGLTRTQSVPDAPIVMLDGARKNTADWRGHVTLVNFWATSCTTCVAEMPLLANTYTKYRDRGYRTLAIAMQFDPPGYVLNFAQSRRLPFEVALDNTGAASNNWGPVTITPTSFVLNKRGEIVKRYIGAPNEAELHALIERLLQES